MFKTHYRVVTDRYLGFEAQVRYWWSPFWIECGYPNTHPSIEKAVDHIKRCKGYKSFKSKPVMYVD
jgi:hypothetical protein